MRVLLVGGAKIPVEFLKNTLEEKFDAIYAVDSGADPLIEMDVYPNFLLGDFDSLSPEGLEAIRQHGVEIHTFPMEKDWTDMELALDLALKQGATSVVIIGGTGERLDHTLANISLLFRAEEAGVEAFIKDTSHQIRLVPPGQQVAIYRNFGSDFSLFPLTREVRGVRVWGAKYPLEDGVLRFGETLGVHNEVSARKAYVVGGDGFMLLVQFRAS